MIDDRRALEILGTFVTYYNNLNAVNMKYVLFMQNKPPRSNHMFYYRCSSNQMRIFHQRISTNRVSLTITTGL